LLSAALGNESTDLMIAATALEHGLTVVTRNVSDFEPTGVPVLDPFKPSRQAQPRRRNDKCVSAQSLDCPLVHSRPKIFGRNGNSCLRASNLKQW